MWEINLGFQILSFIYSIFLGMIFSFFYDVIKSIRLTLKLSSIIVFIYDILFFIIISVFTFIYYMSVTDGEIRYYILLGLLLGFIVFRLTISKLLIYILTNILKFLILIFERFNKGIIAFSELIFSFLSDFLKKVKYFLKKIKISSKKHLKNDSSMLYTNEE